LRETISVGSREELITFEELATNVYFSSRLAVQENDVSSARLAVDDVETLA
jgi:hypothetical protein